jgi:hypothetical protein
MKVHDLILVFLFITIFVSCKKNTLNKATIPIPNGNFEYWTNESLSDWQTSGCPACVPQYQTDVVQQTTDAYSGKYAAKFIYNSFFKSRAYNKFYINELPASLTCYVKANITNGDTVSLQLDLFAGNNIVDSTNWYDTSSIANYKEIIIPVSNVSAAVDSASIKITGGGKLNTILYVDDLQFTKS